MNLRQNVCLNPFPINRFWTLPNSEFSDDNFKFDENGGKFSKHVENTVGKGEIALYDQFVLFHSVSKRHCQSITHGT